MAKQVFGNPKRLDSVDLTTYAVTATGASGTVTSSANISSLKPGQSIFLAFDGGSSGGYTSSGQYYVIPKSSGQIQVATTKQNAILRSPDLTASGNAGAGDIRPNVQIGGTIFVGTGGDILARGIESDSFELIKNVADGQLLPYMLGDVATSGTTASDILKATH